MGALGFGVFLFVSLVLYLLAKHKNEIKKVNNRNKLIVVIIFIGLLVFSGVSIQYGWNWIEDFIRNDKLKTIFQVIWMLIMIAIITNIWNRVVGKVKRDAGIL